MASHGYKTVGHGELIKALNALPGSTHLRVRIAMTYLSYIKPPKSYLCFPSARTVAKAVGCSEKSVHRAKSWLVEQDAVILDVRRGRGGSTIVDFTPLANGVREARVSRNQRPNADESDLQSVSKGDTSVPFLDRVIGTPESLNGRNVTDLSTNRDSQESVKGPIKDPPPRGRTGSDDPIQLSDAIPGFLKKLAKQS